MNRTHIDARGLRCPLPLLKLKQALAVASTDEQLTIVASDAGAWRDIPAYIAISPHRLIEQTEQDGEYSFTVIKGDKA